MLAWCLTELRDASVSFVNRALMCSPRLGRREATAAKDVGEAVGFHADLDSRPHRACPEHRARPGPASADSAHEATEPLVTRPWWLMVTREVLEYRAMAVQARNGDVQRKRLRAAVTTVPGVTYCSSRKNYRVRGRYFKDLADAISHLES